MDIEDEEDEDPTDPDVIEQAESEGMQLADVIEQRYEDRIADMEDELEQIGAEWLHNNPDATQEEFEEYMENVGEEETIDIEAEVIESNGEVSEEDFEHMTDDEREQWFNTMRA